MKTYEYRKDVLIEKLSCKVSRPILDAERSNKSLMATLPRQAFFQLGIFASNESDYLEQHINSLTTSAGISGRFNKFLEKKNSEPGVSFLSESINYIHDRLGIPSEQFTHEIAAGVLGCHHPVPPRMMKFSERIVAEYISREMAMGSLTGNEIDVFAVDGETSALSHIFNTLKENRLINKNDKIAIGIPAFTPYFDMPLFHNHQLGIVPIYADPEMGWEYPESEIDKLNDKDIKIFFSFNSSNPISIKIHGHVIKQIQALVRTNRPDLIIITDDVYEDFTDELTSLLSVCPNNVILVYSYTDNFSSAGWCMAVIAIHKNNILDEMLVGHTATIKSILKKHYASLNRDMNKLKFIDRLVADSRTVALNHAAGLSTPQQVQMVLFSLLSLMNSTYEIGTVLKISPCRY